MVPYKEGCSHDVIWSPSPSRPDKGQLNISPITSQLCKSGLVITCLAPLDQTRAACHVHTPLATTSLVVGSAPSTVCVHTCTPPSQ